MLSREEFVKGPVKTPWPIRGDAYTVSSKNIISLSARQRSVYNFTNRVGPMKALPKGVAKDNRMVFYGLTDFIQRELVDTVSDMDISLSKIFLSDAHSFGGPLDFDKEMWAEVVKRGGRLPIIIQALPEGSTFFPNEPVIQVTSLWEGFGEVAAIIEALMVGYVSCATARATLTRHLLERIREVVRRYHPTYDEKAVDGIAQWMIHDFGMRASSTRAESEIYGRAHLLSFNGTDTFTGAFQAWANNAFRPVGTSILALAHRIVQGHDQEEYAYSAMLKATLQAGNNKHTPIGSYVADCYDFHKTINKFLVAIAKRRDATIVCRPDSGDFLENILYVVNAALESDLYVMDENGRPQATHLRFIQGDSMTWEKINKTFETLNDNGVDPTGWGIFGVGGWLRNTPNRDTFSSAYKLSAVGTHYKPVIKLSDTLAKVSIPGPNILLRGPGVGYRPTVFLEDDSKTTPHFWEEDDAGYVTYYDASRDGLAAFDDTCLEDFNTIRGRCLADFDKYSTVPPDFNPLSRRIIKMQKDLMKAYGKTVKSYKF